MTRIPLTRGQIAIVDDEDYEWLSRWKWRAMYVKDMDTFYAVRSSWDGHTRRTILMHREILRLQKGDRREGDHRNHETLDNRRGNLRVATRTEQVYNTRMKRTNTSGFKGVYRNRNGYSAKIRIDGRQVYLGTRRTPAEAHSLYVEAATKHHGEFACIGIAA